ACSAVVRGGFPGKRGILGESPPERKYAVFLPGQDELSLDDRERAGIGVERRIPDDLDVRLELDHRAELKRVEGLRDVLVVVVDRLRGRRRLAPDEADADVVVREARDESEVLERALHDEAGSDLSRGAARDLRPSHAEPAEPGERRLASELLL